MKVSFLFLFFLFTIQYKCIISQVVTSVHSIDPTYYSNNDTCNGQTSFSIANIAKIETNYFGINANSTSFFSGLNVLVFDQTDLFKQIFTVFYSIENVGQYDLQLFIDNTVTTTYINLGPITCNIPIQPELKVVKVSSTSPRRFDSPLSKFFVEYNTTIRYDSIIECYENVRWVSSCSCKAQSNQVEALESAFVICELSIGFTPLTIPPLYIDVAINIYPNGLAPSAGQNITFQVYNPFTYATTTANSFNVRYPSGYMVNEDFLFQRDGDFNGYTVFNFTKTNGLMTIPKGSGTVKMVQYNSTTDILFLLFTFPYTYNPSTPFYQGEAQYYQFPSSFTLVMNILNMTILDIPFVTTSSNGLINYTETQVVFTRANYSTPFPHSFYYSNSLYNGGEGSGAMNAPLCLISESNDTFKYSFEMPVSSYYSKKANFGFGFKSLPDSMKYSPQIFTNNPPRSFSIIYISFEYATANGYVFTIALTSSIPFVYIKIGSEYLNQTNVIEFNINSGTEFHTTYQKYLKERRGTFTMTLVDLSGQETTFRAGDPYNINFDLIPNYPPIPLQSQYARITDLNYFQFQPSSIDLSNGPVDVTLYFNFSKSIPNMIPYIVFDEIEDIRFTGFYDPTVNRFKIQMTIDDWLVNPTNFIIGDTNGDSLIESLDSDSVYAYLNNPLNGKLSITKNPNGDNLPPIAAKLNISSTVTNGTIGWTINIVQLKKGFKNGIIQVQSEFDPVPYIVNINSTNRIAGDQYNGTYSFEVKVLNWNGFCKTQVFRISKITLYSNSKVHLPFDSVSSILGTSYDANLKQINLCQENIPVLPTLVSIDIPTSVEVGGSNRSVEVKFMVYSEIIIPPYHSTPIVYFTSENGDIFSIQSDYVNGNNTHFSFIARGQLPLGFGYRLIFVSVYGISNYMSSFNSYTSLSLANSGFNYYMTRVFSPIPLIERSSAITDRGGSLSIFGILGYLDAGVGVNINYQDGQGYQAIGISSISTTQMGFKNIPPIKSKFITIKVDFNGKTSNEFTIYPIQTNIVQPTLTPTPTNTPTSTPTENPSNSICPGSPVCNGRGTCKENVGCECQLPWYGPSCSSKIIPIDPPKPQPEPSTIINVTNSNNSTITTSSIQVVEIREVDNLDNTIKRHIIGDWVFTDLTTSHPLYEYYSIINGTNTQVTVTIEYFPNATDIQFGGETIKVQSSSIKFSIEISPYIFVSKTNFLQVIMDATIKGDNQDSCSSSQFGSQNNTKENVQWIKMNIDDTSLYGRFIDIGIIDDRDTKISNKIIEDSNSPDSNQLRSIKVGITVPYFEESVYLDPDFSNLIDVDGNDSNLQCKSKKKLSSGAIAGIVVGCVVAVALGFTALTYFLKKSKSKKENRRVSEKLKQINK